jgi:predicted aldo/keto reductase-like oxidoreductase
MSNINPLAAVQLGRTGITVTRLSAGGHFTNGPTGHQDIPRRVREINHLIDCGIKYIDIQWEPEEEAMAEVLKTRSGEIAVAWPLHGVSNHAPEGLAQYIVDYCDDHRRRYGIDHIDILLWVGLEMRPDTQEQVMAEVREGFAQVKQSGFCDFLAFSCHHSPEMASRALAYSDDFSVMMIPYGVLNPAGAPVIKEAKKRGVGTVGMKPFVGGDGLFNRIWSGEIAASELAVWKASGRPFQAGIRWALANSDLDCSVPGMHSITEIDELCSAAATPYSIEDEAILSLYRKVQAEQGKPLTWEFLHPWLTSDRT